MDRKIQKVINKLIKYGDSYLRCFKEEKDFNLHLLVKSILLLQFNQVHFDDNILADDMSDVDILFLDPSKIFSALEEIYTNVKEQICFLEWYINRVVLFYTTKPLEHYEKMGEILANKINTYLGIIKKNSHAKMDKKEITYLKYKTICEKMKKLYQVGIIYTQQYELLLSLGMSQELVNGIKVYQVSSLLNSCVISKIEEVKKQEDKEQSMVSVVLDSPIKEESIISHRSIKDKLSEYLDLSNLQNKMIIEGDIFLEVDFLLKEIYPKRKVMYVEKRIRANNEKIKRKMYDNAMKELLPNVEDYQLFCEAKKSLHHELKNDAFFSPYLKLIQNIVIEIEKYIESYLLLNDKDKEILKEDYVNLIILCLNELKLHLDFLPFYAQVR